MLFDLHGVTVTFQRWMNQVLAGMETSAVANLDDIVIYSTSWQEHLSHLTTVLGKIKETGLTINLRKCTVAKQETQYLLHPVVQILALFRTGQRPFNQDRDQPPGNR